MISRVSIYNPEIIELIYNGEVELNDDNELVLKSVSGTTGIENTVIINDIIIYPNPATDFIRISNIDELQSVIIYNINGIVIKELAHNQLTEIAISDLPHGIYFIKLLNKSNDTLIRKIIKR